jgi:hypothetical protein
LHGITNYLNQLFVSCAAALQAANLRLLLNAKVYPGMPVQLMPSNVGVTFGVVNAASTQVGREEGGNPHGSLLPASALGTELSLNMP